MQQESRLDGYDLVVLGLVRDAETGPAIIDIFKGLNQQKEGYSKCYDTLRYRLKCLMDRGFLELDTISDRSRTIVRLTEAGRDLLASLKAENQDQKTGREEKPAPEGACFS